MGESTDSTTGSALFALTHDGVFEAVDWLHTHLIRNAINDAIDPPLKLAEVSP